MIDITISLVSCNQRHDLAKLLPSLIPAANAVEAEILLVDNASVDGTAEYVRKNYPGVSILSNPIRTGYGENHNLNLRRARGRGYFVIMNSDMRVEPEIFTRLQRYMEEHADVGIISPRILNEDGSIQGLNKRFPTLFDLFLRRFLPKRLEHFFQKRLAYYEMRDVGYENVCDVPFLSGAFMFCRADILRKLKGFDPDYFLYFEDADLCRRVQRTNRTIYYPYVSVTHFWARSAHKNWICTYHFIKSALRYFGRWGYKLF